MSVTIKLKKGFNINLAGKAANQIAPSEQSETFAIKPTDFPGIKRPKLLAKEGENVKAGTPILFDAKQPDIMYASPVSGEIVEINRGEKRKLLEIKILADRDIEFEAFDKFSESDISSLDKEKCQEAMLKSGVWPNIIQRPYGVVADPQDTPKSIFISTFDTHPLAPDYNFMFKGQEQYFQAGVDVLSKFASDKVHVNIDATGNSIFANTKKAQVNKFSGPHPAGNVGVQIHHISPVNKGEVAWTVNPFGVIQIGKLFLEGKYDASKLVALVGSEVKSPQYYQTYVGTGITKIIKDNLKSEHVRFVSGNALTGEKIKIKSYLGYYDHMITVLPEGDQYEFLGWMKPTSKKLSFHRALGLLSFANGKSKEYSLNTNMNGEERAFVQTGAFEKVLPMDIYPTHLLKAIMAEDFDNMEALGIYEVVEEDLALCEFIDVSKHPVQSIIRDGLNLMQNS